MESHAATCPWACMGATAKEWDNHPELLGRGDEADQGHFAWPKWLVFLIMDCLDDLDGWFRHHSKKWFVSKIGTSFGGWSCLFHMFKTATHLCMFTLRYLSLNITTFLTATHGQLVFFFEVMPRSWQMNSCFLVGIWLEECTARMFQLPDFLVAKVESSGICQGRTALHIECYDMWVSWRMEVGDFTPFLTCRPRGKSSTSRRKEMPGVLEELKVCFALRHSSNLCSCYFLLFSWVWLKAGVAPHVLWLGLGMVAIANHRRYRSSSKRRAGYGPCQCGDWYEQDWIAMAMAIR